MKLERYTNPMTKTILITGANRGLGFALAQRYESEGWRVLPTCRRPQDAHALQELDLAPLSLDVTEASSIDALSQTLAGEPIDILFNNAGIFGPRGSEIGTLAPDAWLEVMKVNVVAPALIAQALVDNVALSEDKLIAFMSSDLGSVTDTSGGEYIYRSSKAALNMVVATLAKDLAPREVRTVALSPGWVRTDMGGPDAGLSAEESAKGLKTVLDTLSPEQSELFLRYDGASVAW